MNKFITKESPQPLIDAYLNNVTFNAVVKSHEIKGSDYKSMLEDAVGMLATEIEKRNKIILKYAERNGVLRDG